MSTPQETYQPFNEQAALEELERLQRELEESRQKRKDASAAFDQFVNSFRKEPRRDPRPEEAAWPRSDVGPSSIVRDSRIAPPAAPASRRRRLPSTAIFAGAIVVTVAAVTVSRSWRADSPESPAPVPASTVAADPLPTSAAPAAQASDTSSAPATQSELQALRRVWVRATVDGNRLVERELEAGARIPLNGRTIVIRAGDPGAVRIVIDGRDRGIMGETGIPVTRTYTSAR